jgi:hypothetical protein
MGEKEGGKKEGKKGVSTGEPTSISSSSHRTQGLKFRFHIASPHDADK